MWKKIKNFLIEQVVKRYLPQVVDAIKKVAKEKGIEILEKILDDLKEEKE